MSKVKKIKGTIKLQVLAGKATPAPPIGPAAGQKGLNPAQFCKDINEATKKYEPGKKVTIFATVYDDRTCSIEVRGYLTSRLILEELKMDKGSSAPGRQSAGSITKEQIKNVAEKKFKDGTSARTIESTIKMVEGCAKSMGLKVVS